MMKSFGSGLNRSLILMPLEAWGLSAESVGSVAGLNDQNHDYRPCSIIPIPVTEISIRP